MVVEGGTRPGAGNSCRAVSCHTVVVAVGCVQRQPHLAYVCLVHLAKCARPSSLWWGHEQAASGCAWLQHLREYAGEGGGVPEAEGVGKHPHSRLCLMGVRVPPPQVLDV